MKLVDLLKFAVPFSLLTLAACSTTPVRSTVDGYGEVPVTKADPHFFAKDSLSLQEKQVADSCKDAAVADQINVVQADCKDCKKVVVRSRVLGTQETVETAGGYPSAWGAGGFRRRYGYGYGLGYGTGQDFTKQTTSREIEIDIYQDKDLRVPVRSIAVRSLGEDNSVAAVAYEMCSAAFQNYPDNLKGKTYEIAPHKN